jgi:hypothetical protein
MGKLLLILVVVFAAFLVVSLVISALHFLFVVALVALVVVGLMRLAGGGGAPAGSVRWRPAGMPGRQSHGSPSAAGPPGGLSRGAGYLPVPRCPGPEV